MEQKKRENKIRITKRIQKFFKEKIEEFREKREQKRHTLIKKAIGVITFGQEKETIRAIKQLRKLKKVDFEIRYVLARALSYKTKKIRKEAQKAL